MDVLQHLDDLRMLLIRYRPGNEDTEVADVLVKQAHDGLPVGLDLLGTAIHRGNPVERLLRRSDVVAHRRENDDRGFDCLQIEEATRGEPRFPSRKLVTDEEIVDDPANLLVVHQIETTPPALEVEEALDLGIDVLPQVVILVPVRVRGVEPLEVLHQMRAVEFPAAQVACEQ